MKYSVFIVMLFLFSACTSKYYIVRHGERLNNTDTTSLSPQGHQRAIALKDLLLNKKIDYIYASKFKRTQQTAQPLAEVLGKPIIIYSPDTTEAVAERLERYSGSNILVVGHSDNIPEFVHVLAHESISPIPVDDFDNLYIVEVQRNLGWISRDLTSTTYGAPSP